MSETALPDLKIIELAQGVAAPYCVKLLGDLGADVVKIEPPTGDGSRRIGPFPDDVPDPERSGQYLYLNTNKRSVSLDVAHPAGHELLLELIGAPICSSPIGLRSNSRPSIYRTSGSRASIPGSS